MGRKTMQRNMTESIVDYSTIEVVGEKPVLKEHEQIKLTGKWSFKQAEKEIAKYHDAKVVVTNVKYETVLYTMPVSQFMELATREETE